MQTFRPSRARNSNLLTLTLTLTLAGMTLSTHSAEAAGRDDIVVLVDPAGVGELIVNDFPLDTTVTGGVVSLQTDNAACFALPGSPCTYVLNAMRLSLSNFTFSGQSITDTVVVVNGPLTVVDEGEGILIPAGTAVVLAFTRDGNRESIDSTSPSGLDLQLNVVTQRLAISGTFSGAKDGVTVEAAVVGSAISPFANLPPVANAGPDQTITCGAPTRLDGSGSSDPNHNLFLLSWSEGGHTIATGAQVTLNLTPGVHLLRLTAIDEFGGQGVDTVQITVVADTTPPVFGSVPDPITISSCVAPNVGIATATDNCGAVTVTSDAPAVFPLGDTLVTYTAKDGAGNLTTASQAVTAELKDNPSCCPAGSNIILGTSNNDVLNGTPGNDCILGRGGQDVLNGLGGNDAISGGDGDDVIDCGAGDDRAYGGPGQDIVAGGTGNDFLDGQEGDDRLNGNDGNDILKGGPGQDRLFGDIGDDQLFGGAGDDELHGGDGNDLLSGEGLHDRCFGGPGFNSFLTCERILGGP
jgi:Ca2+-binding RTX toxin-like protein